MPACLTLYSQLGFFDSMNRSQQGKIVDGYLFSNKSKLSNNTCWDLKHKNTDFFHPFKSLVALHSKTKQFFIWIWFSAGKEVVLLMQALNSLATPEEKLAALCKKYADLVSYMYRVYYTDNIIDLVRKVVFCEIKIFILSAKHNSCKTDEQFAETCV